MTNQANGGEEIGFQGGLAAWLLASFRNGFGRIGKVRSERRMEHIETLQLGGKRQLMLVLCDGHRFLVGAGGDSVHSVTAIGQGPVGEALPPATATEHDARCSR
jgi:flagellar biogenesis protein FliO